MSSVAKERWKILKQALINKNVKINSNVSIRRFSSFLLFSTERIDVFSEGKKHKWFIYTSSFFKDLNIYLSFLDSTIKIENISGFNNTGNLCMWPSEEILCYYSLKNKEIFKDKNVCEIGGGMTCMAGLGIAQLCEAGDVLLTDGNELSVRNINRILEKNVDNLNCKSVHSRLLRWDDIEDYEHYYEHFDFIISADCLFFEDSHNDLMNALMFMLTPLGKAIIFAPRRKNSFNNFAKLANNVFKAEVVDVYDETVWDIHSQNLTNDDLYDEDIHYPVLLILEKS